MNAAAICAPAPDMSCKKTRTRRRTEYKIKVYRIRLGLRQTNAENKEASLTSALFLSDYGCFVPDLTRFAAGPCEGARQIRV